MRKLVAKTAWNLVCGEDNAAQPVALFCGDFNNTLFQCNTVINESLKVKISWIQLCTSSDTPRHGDNALAINCTALDEPSHYGRTFREKQFAFSDAHDLVLIPILCCPNASSVGRLAESRTRRWSSYGSTSTKRWSSSGSEAPDEANLVGRLSDMARRPWEYKAPRPIARKESKERRANESRSRSGTAVEEAAQLPQRIHLEPAPQPRPRFQLSTTSALACEEDEEDTEGERS